MAPPRKYPQIAEQIISEIKCGVYRVGQEFPNLDEMGKIYKVSRATAFRVLSILVKEGYISVGRGRRSIVKSREKASSMVGSGPARNIALLADFGMDVNSCISLKLVYSIQNELKLLGNHVVCFQYHNDMNFRPADMDAYIVFDILGIHDDYLNGIKESGKPYVIIDSISPPFICPNHLHLTYRFALFELVNHLVSNNAREYVFGMLDGKSAFRDSREEQLQKIDAWLNKEILEPITSSLECHNFSTDDFQTYALNIRSSVAQKTIKGITKGINPQSAIVMLSETNALEVLQSLKSSGKVPFRDFQLALIDSVPGTDNHTIPEMYIIRFKLADILNKIIKSLDYQFTNKSNFAPGNIVNAVFEMP